MSTFGIVAFLLVVALACAAGAVDLLAVRAERARAAERAGMARRGFTR